MKKLFTSLSLLAGVTTLVACSSGKDTGTTNESTAELVTTIESPVTIEFWHAMSGTNQEAVDALVALGYSSAEAKEAVDKCKKDGLNTEDIIKKSLTYIMSKSLR